MLTDRAARRFETYLEEVRHCCGPEDAELVIEGLREHVMVAAAKRDEPLDSATLETILERLGDPQSFGTPEAPHPPLWRAATPLVMGFAGAMIATFDRWPAPAFLLLLAGGLLAGGVRAEGALASANRLYAIATRWLTCFVLVAIPAATLWAHAQTGGLLHDAFPGVGPFNLSIPLLAAMAAVTAVWAGLLALLDRQIPLAREFVPRGAFARAAALTLLVIAAGALFLIF